MADFDLEDDLYTNEDPNLLDFLGESLGGLFQNATNVPISNQLLKPVIPEVSKDEANIAATRLAAAQARSQEIKNKLAEQALQREADLKSRVSKLKESSKPGTLTFTSQGDDIRTGDGEKFNPSKGSFSKIKYQDEFTRSRDKLISQGYPEPLADLVINLQKAGKSANPNELEAQKLIGSITPQQTSPRDKALSVLQSFGKSKDIIGAMPLIMAALRLTGATEEEIQQLFPQNNKE